VIIDRITRSQPNELGGLKVAQFDTMDGFRFKLADKSWLLIRFSGTEPIIRIYAESDSLDKVQKLLKAGQALAGI
jgi:phosphomannomutase